MQASAQACNGQWWTWLAAGDAGACLNLTWLVQGNAEAEASAEATTRGRMLMSAFDAPDVRHEPRARQFQR